MSINLRSNFLYKFCFNVKWKMLEWPAESSAVRKQENNLGSPQGQLKASLFYWRPRKMGRFPICSPRIACCPPPEAEDHRPGHNANPWATECCGMGLSLSEVAEALQDRNCRWRFLCSCQRQPHRHPNPENPSLMKFFVAASYKC